ncbi:MAG: DegT/DnrJ/EryC1/StrS family aminotransferase [Acidobacteria bacterium]|nr:DegT/DnrJ/EryC1/StrS family aminotransferase [Acidobacteriota bacterium]
MKYLKPIAKKVAQITIGRLPPLNSRLTGGLAINGGTPVRDISFRPWANCHSGNLLPWFTTVGPAFRRIFLSGVEGLPQTCQKQFSERWAEYCGCRYALLLPHGTDALRLALAAVFDHDGLDYGGEVIVPNLSFIASATCALDRRFGVALVDVEPGTLNLDPERVEEAIIAGKTRAIIAVHQFGQPADITALQAIARSHGLKIIEDAAQAHGAEWETGRVGSLGDAAGFSFQSAKNLTCGEGGILTTNDRDVFERAYSLHNVGRVFDGGWRWEHETLGWNCRPTEYQAALLMHRFTLLERQQEIRARNFQKLRELLKDVSCLEPLAVHPGVRRHGMYMFVMRYRPEHCGGLGIQDFLCTTAAEGAPLHRSYSCTLSDQPAMRKVREYRPEYVRVLPTPVADQAVKETIYISANVFLGTERDMEDIAAVARKVALHYAKGI